MQNETATYRAIIRQLNPGVTDEEWAYFESGFTMRTLKPRAYFSFSQCLHQRLCVIAMRHCFLQTQFIEAHRIQTKKDLQPHLPYLKICDSFVSFLTKQQNGSTFPQRFYRQFLK